MSGPLGASQYMYSAAAGAFYSHQIEQSAYFHTDSRLYRTMGTVSSQTAFTFSCWVKRSETYENGMQTAWQSIISTGSGIEGGGGAFGFESGGGTSGGLDNRDRIAWYGHKGTSGGTAGGDDRIAGYYRDTTGWYNIVVRVDTSQTSGNRVKYYVNGDGPKERTTQNNPAGNLDNFHVATSVLNVGANTNGGYGINAYLADVVYCDGQSLGPTSFGESKNGVWIPVDPSGLTFGNQGFYLKFGNASDLGEDSSGNNNDFTVANLAAADVSLDTPTAGAGS